MRRNGRVLPEQCPGIFDNETEFFGFDFLPQFVEPPSALPEPPPEIGNFAFAGLGGRVLELGLEIAQALVSFVTQGTDAGAPNAVAGYIERVQLVRQPGNIR